MTKKSKEKVKRYSFVNALVAGFACGSVAMLIGYLIEEQKINHDFEGLFSYAAVGLVISIINFKPLSKLSVILLPPVYAMSGFGIVAGAMLMHRLGWNNNNVSDVTALIVENVPFFIFATILFNWYSSLAGKKSFIIYATFATMTVVVSMLIFKDHFQIYLIEGLYLGAGAFLFSLLHLKQPL